MIGQARGLFDWLPGCVDLIGREVMNNTECDWSSPLLELLTVQWVCRLLLSYDEMENVK